jgi:hypothetical protein
MVNGRHKPRTLASASVLACIVAGLKHQRGNSRKEIHYGTQEHKVATGFSNRRN